MKKRAPQKAKTKKKSPTDSRPVLFVCTANFFRSRFAEAYFNHEAEKRGLTVRAISRGILSYTPLFAQIHPHTRRAMDLHGIAQDKTGIHPIQLKPIDFENAQLIIALSEQEHRPMMEQFHTSWATKITYWNVEDEHIAPAETAIQTIKELVNKLLTTDF